MNRVFLIVCTILYSTFVSAQSISTHRIDYIFNVDPKLLEIDPEKETDPEKKELASTALLLSIFQDGNNPIAQVWTSKEYVRANNNFMVTSFQLVNKTSEKSYSLYPETKQYVESLANGIDNFLLSENASLDIPLEFVPNTEKTIAGYKCKLAKKKIDEEGKLPSVEIWYTEQIPTAFWGEYNYLSQLPGAALSINTLGLGIEASAVTKEEQTEAFFSIPEDYTLMEEGSESDYGTSYPIAENRIVFLDTISLLYGLKDSSDNIILQPAYSTISSVNNGKVIVANEEYLWGIVKENGEIIIPFQYESLQDDEENDLFLFSKDGLSGYLDKTGKVLIPAQYEYLTFFRDGYCSFTKNELNGLLDKTGKTIVPATHSYIMEWNTNHLITIENETLYHIYDIKTNKKILADLEYVTFGGEPNLFLTIKNEKYGFIDHNGKTIIPFIYDVASPFTNGISTVSTPESVDEIFYINTKGEKVQAPAEVE